MSILPAPVGAILTRNEKETFRRDTTVERMFSAVGADEAGTYARPPGRRVRVGGRPDVRNPSFPAVYRERGGSVRLALPRPTRPGYSFSDSNRYYAADPLSLQALRAEVERLRDEARPRTCRCGALAEPVERCNQCGSPADQHPWQCQDGYDEPWAFIWRCARCGLRMPEVPSTQAD